MLDAGYSIRPPEKPQRHRVTEIAQRFFRIPSQPPRHKDTKKSPSHPPTQEKPQITQIDAESIASWIAPPLSPTASSIPATNKAHRSPRWAHTALLCVARFRPSNGREPLGRESDTKAGFRSGFPTQRLAFQERKPRHLSSSFNDWKAHTLHYNNIEERQNRSAKGTSAGEKTGGDGCLHPESSGFSPATGDS